MCEIYIFACNGRSGLYMQTKELKKWIVYINEMKLIMISEWNIFVFSSCFKTVFRKSNEEIGGQLLKPLTINTTNNHQGGGAMLHMWVYDTEKKYILELLKSYIYLNIKELYIKFICPY